tara:strand:- start:424 stop:804 length:381 start_codon:yes stop_codon:yes gene_type:complete
MLSQVKIYKPNKKTNKLEHHKTISKEEVKIIYDSALTTSNSHISTSDSRYKNLGKATHPKHKKSKPATHSQITKYAPGARKQKCMMCDRRYYATNKRNTKFCSQKCGRNMSNEYKKERERAERNKS